LVDERVWNERREETYGWFAVLVLFWERSKMKEEPSQVSRNDPDEGTKERKRREETNLRVQKDPIDNMQDSISQYDVGSQD